MEKEIIKLIERFAYASGGPSPIVKAGDAPEEIMKLFDPAPHKSEETDMCQTCKGHGELSMAPYDDRGVCPHCNGSGNTPPKETGNSLQECIKPTDYSKKLMDQSDKTDKLKEALKQIESICDRNNKSHSEIWYIAYKALQGH